MSDVTKKNTIGVIPSSAEWKLIHYTDVSPESIERIAETVAKRLAKPERKKGKWIRHILKNANVPWGYNCSVCNEWFVIGEDTAGRYRFCPNCGADMRGNTHREESDGNTD